MTWTRVQQNSDGGNTTTLTVTLPNPPTPGHLLLAWANSNATVTIGGTGWTLGPSVIDGNGTYAWWKVAAAGEPASVDFTPINKNFICSGLLEYAGNTASPLDVTGTSTISGHSGTTATTPVSVTTGTSHDLGVALGCLHNPPNLTTDPTTPVWSGGYTNIQAQGCGTSGDGTVFTFTGDNTDLGPAGTTTTGVSWSTTTFTDAQQLVITFHPAAAYTETMAATITTSPLLGPWRISKALAVAAVTLPAAAKAATRALAVSVTTSPGLTRGVAPQPLVTSSATMGNPVLRGVHRALAGVTATTALTVTEQAVRRALKVILGSPMVGWVLRLLGA